MRKVSVLRSLWVVLGIGLLAILIVIPSPVAAATSTGQVVVLPSQSSGSGVDNGHHGTGDRPHQQLTPLERLAQTGGIGLRRGSEQSASPQRHGMLPQTSEAQLNVVGWLLIIVAIEIWLLVGLRRRRGDRDAAEA
ncbi:hypothetical protein [Lacticaseibacillus pantheris]|uniref:hypothetical protein n=1 Tax=Lacticaseibacillus pantheris TaxID=171523 RepID=UPI000704A1C8|nr:hypothetical protein [Lacticaseibacillus pantheris]